MLLQLLAQHPEALVPVLRQTPWWVWGLLLGLLALGASQQRERTASLARVSLMPVAMTVFSVSGTFSVWPLAYRAGRRWLVAPARRGVCPAGACQPRAVRRPRRACTPAAVPPCWLMSGSSCESTWWRSISHAPQLVQDAG